MICLNPNRSFCPKKVGELYFTIADNDPADIWPGTSWRKITDCMIRAADSNHAAGSTGGSWTHALDEKEMPAHSHTENLLFDGFGVRPAGKEDTQVGSGKVYALPNEGSTGASNYITTGTTGEGKEMDITNRYFAANIWIRTA